MQLNVGTWWCDLNGYVGLGALRLVRHQLELVGHPAELGKRCITQPAAIEVQCSKTPSSSRTTVWNRSRHFKYYIASHEGFGGARSVIFFGRFSGSRSSFFFSTSPLAYNRFSCAEKVSPKELAVDLNLKRDQGTKSFGGLALFMISSSLTKSNLSPILTFTSWWSCWCATPL
jgi:hypothetical protein